MNIRHETLNIGLKNPVKLLHISDTHLCFADERDNGRKITLAKNRDCHFHTQETLNTLEPIIQYARENNITIVHTGDLIDFVSYLNVDKAKEFARGMFFVDGNHEFSKYVGEGKEDEAYILDSLPLVQTAFENDIRFSSRIAGEINLVGIDDIYYHFRPEHVEKLKQEVSKGIPIILCMHVPLFEKKLYDICAEKEPVTYLVGVPEELMDKYPADRKIQQLPTEYDLEVCRFIDECDMIKAVLAGHIHFPVTASLPSGKPQLICGVCTDACEITII